VTVLCTHLRRCRFLLCMVVGTLVFSLGGGLISTSVDIATSCGFSSSLLLFRFWFMGDFSFVMTGGVLVLFFSIPLSCSSRSGLFLRVMKGFGVYDLMSSLRSFFSFLASFRVNGLLVASIGSTILICLMGLGGIKASCWCWCWCRSFYVFFYL